MILTPNNDPFFYQTLHHPELIPNYTGGALVVDVESGLFREVDAQGFKEYAFGGEYDLRLEQIGESDIDYAID